MYPPTGHSLGNGCFVFPPGWYWIATLSGLMWTLFFQIVNLNGCWQHSHFNGHIFAAMSATGQKKRRAFGQGLEQEKVEKLSFQGSGDHKPRATRVHVRWSGNNMLAVRGMFKRMISVFPFPVAIYKSWFPATMLCDDYCIRKWVWYGVVICC